MLDFHSIHPIYDHVVRVSEPDRAIMVPDTVAAPSTEKSAVYSLKTPQAVYMTQVEVDPDGPNLNNVDPPKMPFNTTSTSFAPVLKNAPKDSSQSLMPLDRRWRLSSPNPVTSGASAVRDKLMVLSKPDIARHVAEESSRYRLAFLPTILAITFLLS